MSTTTDLGVGDGVSLEEGHAEDSDQHICKQTPRSRKQRKKLPLDVIEEIDDMYENVPQVAEVFNVKDRIGSGTFSSVYLAQLRQCPQVTEQFALKHIIPTSHPTRIENELRCLQEIGGCDYVMGVKACIREKDHVVIVMPYFPHDRFQDYVQDLGVKEVQEYMFALLTALKRVHDVDIIHRDVKPSNFLYNRQTKQYSLVDFGLAMKAPVLLKTKSSPEATTATQKSSKSPSQLQKKLEENKSPRITRQSTGAETTTVTITSPRKRKLNPEDAENFPESPRKKRTSGENGTLAEIDMNVSRKNTSKSQSLTPGLSKPQYGKTVKSPRRALLTKRALDIHQKNDPAKTSGARTSARNNAKNDKQRTVVIHKNSSGKSVYKSLAPTSCQCHSKAQICSMCLARSAQHAPRAGTQGFRSPEVLMKYPDQTTAVDMWSAGVIFLSMLCARYPLFKAQDDITALAQVVSIFGTNNMKEAAEAFGKTLVCHPVLPSLDLRTLCGKLRGLKTQSRRSPTDKDAIKGWYTVPDSAYDLVNKLCGLNPHERISAEDALKHPFFSEVF